MGKTLAILFPMLKKETHTQTQIEEINYFQKSKMLDSFESIGTFGFVNKRRVYLFMIN